MVLHTHRTYANISSVYAFHAAPQSIRTRVYIEIRTMVRTQHCICTYEYICRTKLICAVLCNRQQRAKCWNLIANGLLLVIIQYTDKLSSIVHGARHPPPPPSIPNLYNPFHIIRFCSTNVYTHFWGH